MAKKRTYEAEIKVSDSFSKLLDKFTKKLDTVDDKIDDINKNKIKVQAELDSSFKNAAKQIEKQIPSNKKIKVSASQDISRELDKANRDIFEMNRKLNANLDSAFKSMASNAKKSVQSINSAVSSLKANSSSSITSKLSGTLKSASLGSSVGKSIGGSAVNGLVGGTISGIISKNRNKDNTKNELNQTEKTSSNVFKKIGNTIDKLKNINLKSMIEKIKEARFGLKGLGEAFSGKFEKVKSGLSNIANSAAGSIGKRLPGSMGANYTANKLSGASNTMSLKLAVKDTVSNTISKIRAKVLAVTKPIYNIYIAAKDKVTNIIGKIRSKVKTLTKATHRVLLSAKDKVTNTIGKIKGKTKALTKVPHNLILGAKDKATRTISKVRSLSKPLGKTVKTVLTAVDKATKITKKVLSGLKTIGGKATKVVITAVDKASGIIKSIGGKIAGLAKAAGAIVIGGGTLAISEGMNLEKQTTSMQHFMDRLNPGGDTDGYIKQLREQANNTPFETGEIMGAGARALQVANGDIDKSMKLVKMASDMAAANPGKTVEMAMEALADANLGESARLTEFGIKMSSEELQQSGGLDGLIAEGGELNKLYDGASEALAKTASGKWSTITGKMKSGMADMGKYVLDAANSAGLFDKVISKIDAIFAGNNAQTFAQNIINTFTRLKDALAPAIEPIKNMFSNMFGNVDVGSFVDGMISNISRLSTAAAPIVQAFCNVIQQMAPRIQPIIDNVITIFEKLSPSFTAVVNAITPVLDFFMSVFEKVSQFIIDNSDTINTIVQTLGEIWEKVWNGLSTVLGAVWEFLEPILSSLLEILGWLLEKINGFLDGIGKIAKKIGDKWNSFTNWLGGGDDDDSTKSNAAGLNRVPYDGYETVLHQGEMVLTRNAADHYRQGGSTPNITFGNITITGSGNPSYDAKKLVKEVVNELSGAMINFNPVG